jgi:hypothetical protein
MANNTSKNVAEPISLLSSLFSLRLRHENYRLWGVFSSDQIRSCITNYKGVPLREN